MLAVAAGLKRVTRFWFRAEDHTRVYHLRGKHILAFYLVLQNPRVLAILAAAIFSRFLVAPLCLRGAANQKRSRGGISGRRFCVHYLPTGLRRNQRTTEQEN